MNVLRSFSWKLSILFILILPGVDSSQWQSGDELFANLFTNGLWKFEIQKKGNVSLYYQKGSYAHKKSDQLLKHTILSLEDVCNLINAKPPDSIKIVLLNTTEQMRIITGRTVKGLALRKYHCVILVNNDSIRPYIKHELMHLVSAGSFGLSDNTPFWMIEGVSVYAEKVCLYYSLDELGAYFVHKKLFLSIDTLQNNFSGHPDMVTYMESGFIVQYLIKNYGVDKFRTLWMEGYSSFNSIYGISIDECEKRMKEYILRMYPICPKINWDLLMDKGCG